MMPSMEARAELTLKISEKSEKTAFPIDALSMFIATKANFIANYC